MTERLRLGEHYSVVTLDRRVGPMRVWEFVHAPNGAIPDHRHERAHVLVVLSGKFTQQERELSQTFGPGDAVLHPRGAAHSNAIGEGGARTLAIEFEDDYLARHLPENFVRLGQDIALPATAGPTLAKAVRRPDAELERAVRTALTASPGRAGETPDWVASITRELDANPAHTPNVAALSKIAGRHPAHMMREFRRRVGVTIGEYVRARRIAAACDALKETDAALSAIAAAHGFADQSHFVRTFKRFTNMTPDAYRKARLMERD